MEENYLKSALDAQASYHETVGRCLHTLVSDIFSSRPALQRVQVELDHTAHPPYSRGYAIKDIMVDLGIGWIDLPAAYAEDVGKLVHYIYTHAPAVATIKGVGLLAWSRTSYCETKGTSTNYVPNLQPPHTSHGFS